jgi:DNA-directed RNA polymerase specialized sigma24 family protein
MLDSSTSARSGDPYLRLVKKQQSGKQEVPTNPPARKMKREEKAGQNRRLWGLVTLANQGDKEALETLTPVVEELIRLGAINRFRSYSFIEKDEAKSEAWLIAREKMNVVIPDLKRIAERGESLNERNNLLSYFFTTGSNAAKDMVNKEILRACREVPSESQETNTVSKTDVPDSWSKTQEGLSQHRLALERCKKGLNKEESVLLDYRMRDDMDYCDIAVILKKREDAVRQRWSRILKKLRKCMGVPSSSPKYFGFTMGDCNR